MHPLIPVHIIAGGVALITGFVVLALRKGGPLHKWFGTAFFAGMLGMAGTGAVIALTLPERGTAVIGVLTCYLVATSWASARSRSGEAGMFEFAACGVALSCLASFLALGLLGLAEPDGKLDELPAGVHFPFAAIAGLAAALDISFLRRRLAPNRRILRHLWRMLTAMLIATMSFFLGQQKVMPLFIQGSPLLFVPILLVIGSLLFWVVRVRFAKRWRRGRAARAPSPPAEAAA